ncbi:BREX-1 system phosphatase PglZ type A [Membranihabitans maritimus]|uniref:BREX-1 system phosphatase PglZ type A n=1 Tax=Membranihabitans maritimus TaxID=2904244 RepID=UPI001F000125|nr:BREX-1 system phosphatase PglZ type A [Membranihabitans maritimus]
MKRIEESLHKIFLNHRVVFWYDDEEKLREQYEAIALNDIEKIEVNSNEFQVKYTILRGFPRTKFLLYFPEGEKPHDQNWLLDLQLAYKEFHTDQEAMFLQELGLDYYLKEFVRSHIEFFQNKERRAKLKELIAEGDSERDLEYKLMAVVFNTDYPNLEAYIQAYANAYIDGNSKVERELERFNLSDLFWRTVRRKFDYHNDQPAIYDFLMDVFSRNFSPTNEGRSIKETKILLSLWKDAISYQDAFRRLSDKLADDLQIESKLQDAPLESVLQDDLFKIIDLRIIHELVHRVVDQEFSLDKLASYTKTRENKYWYSEFKDFYECLLLSANMFDKVSKAVSQKISSVEEAAMLYAKDLYLIDYYYRKSIYHYRQTGRNRVLQPLMEKVLKVYSNDWLLALNNKLQDRVNDMDAWIQNSQKAQNRFFQNHVKSFTNKPQRLFVVISDALRYENGWELCQDIQTEKRYEADIDYMITGLPSYTQLGMAALLPHQQLNIHPGDCAVLADGISTVGLQGRTKVLETNSGVRAVAINAEDFMKMNASTEGRSFVKQYDLIYIYHNRIDKTGDDKTSEDKVFEAVDEEIAFLKELLRKIANVNGNNIFITADHGYIYQHETLEESEFASVDVKGEVWKTNRRFILGRNLEAANALKKFNGSQLGLTEDVDVLITKGINRLRIKGAGSRYVHGGASLQEIVVPLLKVSKKREDTTTQVDVDIIKSTDKITTNILAVSFLQKELVTEKVQPRQLRAFIKAEDGETLSDIFNYNFNATEGSERQREVKHRFQLSSQASGKYKNQRVSLILEEPVEGTSKWKEYESYLYTLNISFTNDFDDF